MADDKNNNISIFSGLEHLGFNDTENIEIFKKEVDKSEKVNNEISESQKQLSLIYEKEIICPVCENRFKAKAVKISAPRMVKKDSDFFIRYENINPYFYDVWLCNICGYAAMKIDFERIKGYQIERVQKEISMKWKGKSYPDVYDVNTAIERYKLSLLNYAVIDAKASAKAMNCLKLAWMFRLIEDFYSESIFLNNALQGFNEAYYNEDFPIYGMNRYTTMYLIGELNRRLENYEESLVWLSKVVTTPAVPQKLKELARDQKDIIKASMAAKLEDDNTLQEPLPEEKKNFFLNIFKRSK